MWTRFMDMHSGGGCKEKPYEYIYIEAPEDEACSVFYSRFGHNPSRVSCTCCGDDYSISEEPDLTQATAYDRGCRWVSQKGEGGGGHYADEPDDSTWRREYIPLDDFIARNSGKTILLIRATEIQPEERSKDVPEQGYVWSD